MTAPIIESPDSPALDDLCRSLAESASDLQAPGAWPGEQLARCGQSGVFRWFLPREHGGYGWSDADIVRGYLALSEACLTTTFVITQLTGACRRLVAAGNKRLLANVLPRLAAGEQLATLGISHLTTSHRHLSKPVLAAEEIASGGYRLKGFIPWVTAAPTSQYIVTGATLADRRQILVLLPTDRPGVEVGQPADLVALTASRTGKVVCNSVEVAADWLLAGPVENVMQQGVGAKTGGLQTSTLAVGLARAAVGFLEQEARRRDDLRQPAGSLRTEVGSVAEDLIATASGQAVCSTEELRTRANSLVLRATQAALAAAKGAGYVVGHPAGRWCCEALFFLVWSCPQPVMNANLCEFAGIGGEA